MLTFAVVASRKERRPQMVNGGHLAVTHCCLACNDGHVVVTGSLLLVLDGGKARKGLLRGILYVLEH